MINLTTFTLEVKKDKTARYPLNKKIASPNDIEKTLREVFRMEYQTEEIFCIITLDTKNKITGLFEVSRGTLNASLVHPREVFKRAILMNANSIILGHNHPSGLSEPSKEDKFLTERLVEAGKIIGISILDHIIIGEDEFYSFKENGLL